MSQQNECDTCLYYTYDEAYESYYCQMDMDEDELARSMAYRSYHCPYYRFGDEYTIVRKQN